MTTFTDIFKKSFLQETGNLTTDGFIMSMIAAFLCGMILYFVYRFFYKGVIYNQNFNMLLVLVSIVTCFIVIVISSNVLLSLGMVGALSIVRFRTAIKDPLDVGFLFWAVSIGVTSGAGLYLISFMGTIFIAFVYILLVKIKSKKRVYLLIVKFDTTVTSEVLDKLSKMKKVLKNRTTAKGFTEFTYEIKIHAENTAFVSDISQIKGVESAVVVEFTGDYCE